MWIRDRVCIAFGVAAASVLVWLTFRLNSRYGEHGLIKLLAARRHPRYLLNRKSLRRLLKRKGAVSYTHLVGIIPHAEYFGIIRVVDVKREVIARQDPI